ncbi:MAG: hypothetical protein ACTHZ1_11870 [Sphingobacterium sp.]
MEPMPLKATESKLKIIDFKIANQIVRLRVPESFNWQKELISFDAFFTPYDADAEVCLEAEVRYGSCDIDLGQRTLLSDVSIVWERFLFEDSQDYYITTVKKEDEAENSLMVSSKDFGSSVLFIPDAQEAATAINWLLMVQFGQRVLEFGGVMMHSSVVENGREGYAFLGKSGTGKSTHSRMWLTRYPDFRLLNDDNPVLILDELRSQVWIYGSPWSGKTPCYRAQGVPLKGIVRLEQASENKFTVRSGSQAFISLMPSGTGIRWNSDIFSKMLDNLETVSQLTTVGHLQCLPNTAAAELCFERLQP